MLARGVSRQMMEHGPDHPWSGVRDQLAACDFLIGNLECVLTDRGIANPESDSCFRAPPATLAEFPQFAVLNLANNHIRDFGDVGIEDTVNALAARGIDHIGVGRTRADALAPAVLCHSNGMRVAVFGATTMRNVIGKRGDWYVASIDDLKADFDALASAQKADVFVAMVHMGYENNPYPAPEVRQLARELVEIGFDVVLGHHPHVLQGFETHQGGFIAYSLGDFVFDGKGARKETLLLSLDVSRTGIGRRSVLPLVIDDDFRPVVPADARAEQIKRRVDDLSGLLQSKESDRLFYAQTRGSFLSSQVSNLVQLCRRMGVRGILHKLSRLRLQHLKILGHCLFHGAMNRRRKSQGDLLP